jgi:hypothetical protein
VLILLRRRPDHTEPQQRHFFVFMGSCLEKVSSTPLLRLSARLSSVDFPDFVPMVLRGDLSLMTDLSERKPERLRSPTLRLAFRANRLSARFGLRCPHAVVHARERGCRVPVVAKLQPPPGENTTDTPAPAAWTGARVDALVLDELHDDGRVPHEALVVERP